MAVPLECLAYRFDIVLRGRGQTFSRTSSRGADMTWTMNVSRSDLRETPSQTAGPYVHIGLIPHQAGFDIFDKDFTNDIAAPGVEGERITIEGRIFDGSGGATRDVLVETWQANAAGRYAHPDDRQENALDERFRGWARTGTDFETGVYTIRTIKPGSVVGRKGRKTMAPHINFWLAARGINIGLATRMYFEDQQAANSIDPVS